MWLKSLTFSLVSLRYYFIFASILVAPLIFNSDITLILQTLIAAILVFSLILNRRKLDLFDATLLFFGAYGSLITLARGIETAGVIYSLMILPLVAVYTKHEIQKSNLIFKNIYVVHVLVVLANFVTMFFHSIDDKGAAHYLIGGKNALTIFLVPAMFYIAYYSHLKYGKLTSKNLALIIISVATLIIGGSSTAIVIALLAALSILFIHRIGFSHVFYFTAFVVMQIFTVSAHLLYEIPYLSDFITNFLGKDLTFSGRTHVWEITTNAINSSFFGYGKGNSIVSSQIPTLSESHNMVLEIMLTGGVILLVIFGIIALGVFSFKKTKENRNLYHLSAFFMFLYFVLGLTESVPFKVDLWIMFAVIISTNTIMSNQDRLETKI